MSQIVRSALRGRVHWVTLDNPEKKNALDRAAMAALGEAFRASDADDETRVVVLTGAGKAFCTGADLVAAQESLRQEGEALDQVLADEPATVKRLVRTEDVREGIASFLEKRDPVFRSR